MRSFFYRHPLFRPVFFSLKQQEKREIFMKESEKNSRKVLFLYIVMTIYYIEIL